MKRKILFLALALAATFAGTRQSEAKVPNCACTICSPTSSMRCWDLTAHQEVTCSSYWFRLCQ